MLLILESIAMVFGAFIAGALTLSLIAFVVFTAGGQDLIGSAIAYLSYTEKRGSLKGGQLSRQPRGKPG